MLDFLDRVGGDVGNPYAKEYLDAELDEDSGAAFNSFNVSSGESTDDEEDGDSGWACLKKRKRKEPPRRGGRGAKKATVMEAIEKGGRQMKETGDAMVREMQRSAEPSLGDLLDQVKEVSKDLDRLEEDIEKLQANPGRSEMTLARKKEQLAMTLATYEKLKVQHGKALCRTYETE